ncbi:cytochrome c biogenesis protein CcdA [Mycoavidus sp. B2-EB]|nr:cytochrome c biogenesis protein CcdA [Mycoavidus sp. B2-EB]
MAPATPRPVTTAPDIALIGGGLMGRLMGWQLVRSGYRVALYERGDATGSQAAAWAAAGMLAPLAEAALAEVRIAELGIESLALWPAILAQLPEPVFFQRNGTLVVWHTADRAQALLFEQSMRAHLSADLQQAGIVKLQGPALQAAEPALGTRFSQALLLPHEGQLDNRQLLAALATGLAQHKAELHWGVTIDDLALPTAGLVIDCRGLGAKPSWPALRGVRGEVIRVQAANLGLTRPVRLLHPRYPLYIAPKENGIYVIGATEIESEDQSAVSVRSALELLSAAFSVHPAFGEARILELNTQCRPTLPDHQPAIAWDGARILRINGLSRHGYLIAPALCQQAFAMIELLLAGKMTDPDAFDAWRQQTRWPALFQNSPLHPIG